MSARTGLGWACVWGTAGAFGCASVACLEPNMLEEGLILHVAERLLAGESLYRDIVWFTGPLPFEFLALLFRCFGDHFFVARVVVVALHGLSTAAVFGIARRVGVGTLAHVAAAIEAAAPLLLFPLFSIYFYTTLATFLTTLAVYASIRALTSVSWAVGAGVLVACTALCKQTVGVALSFGLVGGVAIYAGGGRRLATLSAMIAGGAVVGLATLAAFSIHGTVGDLFNSLVTMPLQLGESFRMPFPTLWPPGVLDEQTWRNWPFYLPRLYLIAVPDPVAFPWSLGLTTWVLYVLPFAALLAVPARGIRGRLPAGVWLNAAALVAAATNLFPRTDWGHLSMVLPTAAVQLVLITAPLRARSGRDSLVRRVAAGGLLVAIGAGAIYAGQLVYDVAAPQPWVKRVPVRPVSRVFTTAAVPRVIEYLRARTRPGDAIFVARQEPLLYFATETRNPTRYEGMIEDLREPQETEILTALRLLRYVVMSEIDQPACGYYSEELPGVQAYLERYFRVPADFAVDLDQWLLVLERGPDRGATAIDLLDRSRRGSYWLRDNARQLQTFDGSRLPHLVTRHLRRPFPVVVGATGGGVDFELDVPERGRFQADVGLGMVSSLQGVFQRSVGETFSLALAEGGDFEVLREVKLQADPFGEKTWQPFEVDLSPWAGRRVSLRLQVVPDHPTVDRIAWWGSPKIVRSDEPTPTPATTRNAEPPVSWNLTSRTP